MCEDGVSAVLNLSQRFKITQQYVTQPLGIYTWNLPLLGLLIFKPNGSEDSNEPREELMVSATDLFATEHRTEDGLQATPRSLQ